MKKIVGIFLFIGYIIFLLFMKLRLFPPLGDESETTRLIAMLLLVAIVISLVSLIYHFVVYKVCIILFKKTDNLWEFYLATIIQFYLGALLVSSVNSFLPIVLNFIGCIILYVLSTKKSRNYFSDAFMIGSYFFIISTVSLIINFFLYN